MSPESKSIKVLYVEDNPIDVDLTVNHFMFEAPEFEFTIAPTGKAFWKHIAEKNFDLYLMDHHLPDTLGIDLVKELVARKNSVPFVMVTGLGDEQIVTNALRLGAADYLPKHGDYLQRLPDILKRVIASAKKQSANALAFDRIKVLYIERNPMDMEQVVEYFKHDTPAIEFISASDAVEAWKILNNSTDIDLILCDLHLSGIDGVEFLHDLKLKNRQLPFIMITGQGSEESALAALKLGAYDYVLKSKNYIEKLPHLIQSAYVRFKLEKTNINLKSNYETLLRTVEEKVNERTFELINEINERKKVELELRESEEKLSNAIMNAPFPIMIHAEDGNVEVVNDEWLKITGYSREEISTIAKWTEKAYGIKKEIVKDDIEKLYGISGKVDEGEYVVTTKSGDNRIWYFSSSSLGKTVDGRRLAISMALDFTDRKRIVEALASSEKRYRDLFDANPLPMWVYDLDNFIFLEVNYAAIANYGYSRDEFLQMTLKDIRPEEEITRLLDDVGKNRPEYQKSGGWKHRRKDGALIDVEITSHIIDFKGKKSVLVLSQDVTQRKLTEAELRKSEERYSAFVKQSSEAICLFELEHSPVDTSLPVETQIDLLYENAVITENNKTFATSHGYIDPSEMNGIKIGQIFPRLAKENLNYLRSFINGNYSTSQVETKEMSKDGSVTYFLNSLIGSVEDGKLLRIWGAKQDISRIKQAEAENLVLNEKLQLLILAIQELSTAKHLSSVIDTIRIYTRELVDADGSTFILKENDNCFYVDEDAMEPLWKGQRFPMKSCISGWAMMNKKQVTIQDIYADQRIPHEAYRTTFVKSLAMVPIRTSDPIGAIGAYWSTNHAATDAELSLIQTLADAASNTIENITLLSDLEERVSERTNELLAANKELESFSYSVSHDLRAPLRAISGFTNILKEDYAEKLDQEGKGYLQTVLDNTRRMGELIDDLLRLSRISKQGLNKKLVSMKELFTNVFDELTFGSEINKIKFTVVDLPDATVDSQLMKIALSNLLSNAIKFSSKNNEQVVEVGCVKQDEEIAYFVKDNGVGFNMAYAGKLFDVFQRLHRIDEFEGTGIGLAIVQRIIHKHGGKIWAESELNKGATFYFSLPV